jgi:hypothetical protein
MITGSATRIVLIDDQHGENTGYPGAKAWKDYLYYSGNLAPSHIITVPCLELLHTFSEALALVRHAKECGWKSLIIVAPPFHQLRAFISVVSAIRKLGVTDLRVYNQVGTTLPWHEESRHSQGTLKATRLGLVLTELARVYRYHEKGDLVSVSEVLDYLEWRDKV